MLHPDVDDNDRQWVSFNISQETRWLGERSYRQSVRCKQAADRRQDSLIVIDKADDFCGCGFVKRHILRLSHSFREANEQITFKSSLVAGDSRPWSQFDALGR